MISEIIYIQAHIMYTVKVDKMIRSKSELSTVKITFFLYALTKNKKIADAS